MRLDKTSHVPFGGPEQAFHKTLGELFGYECKESYVLPWGRTFSMTSFLMKGEDDNKKFLKICLLNLMVNNGKHGYYGIRNVGSMRDSPGRLVDIAI